MADRKTEKLSAKMKSQAVGLGLCQQWTDEWADSTSKDELVEKFVRGIDFCIEHNFPSCEVIRKEFGDVIHDHGVYVDENVIASDKPTVILNGECVAELSYSGKSCGDIYVRHDCEATVFVNGLARAFINIYDNAEVEVYCEEGAKAFVYLHGGRVRKTRGDVTIRIKHKEKEE